MYSPSVPEFLGGLSEDEQPAGAVDATQPASGLPHRDPEAVAIDIPSAGDQQQTNSIWLKSKTAAIEVLPDLLPDLGRSALSLGALYILPSVGKAIYSAIEVAVLGSKIWKKIPEIRNITAGCLQFEVRCFTEEIFLEILRDYESGKIKERLEEEFVRIGIKTKGLEVKILNSEEVERTKTAIEKRYAGKWFLSVLIENVNCRTPFVNSTCLGLYSNTY